MNYCDAHCHLMPISTFHKATERGVRSFCVNTTRPEEWQQVIDLQSQVLGIYPCFGIHPWFTDTAYSGWEKQLRDMLHRHPNAMIGEIGLDATRSDMPRQRQIFESCLQIASDCNRSVHIHCVRAWDDLFDILGNYRDVKPLFHRFSGDEVIVQKLRLFNAYFSVLNKRVIDIIPDNRLLVESDAPDGLQDPSNIPDLIEQLGVDANYIAQNWELFIDD